MQKLSLNDFRKALNPLFLDRLVKEYGIHITDQIIRGFSEDKSPIIRINTLKTDVRTIMNYLREKNIRYERIPFLENALIIQNQNEKFFENLDIYKKGEIYFQSISSQLPVIFLNPQSGEKILDIAAAPGSKTTQLGIAMRNKGEIIANELDKIRHERLKYNLEKQGITIAKTILGDGSKIGDQYPDYFDRVLVDVPCSAEGRINLNEPRSYGFWSEKNIKENVKIQKKLLESAIKSLRSGGFLLYSTCTLAPDENEGMITWATTTFPNVKVENISLGFKYQLPTIKGAIKAMPSKISEGFFVALLKKI